MHETVETTTRLPRVLRDKLRETAAEYHLSLNQTIGALLAGFYELDAECVVGTTRRNFHGDLNARQQAKEQSMRMSIMLRKVAARAARH